MSVPRRIEDVLTSLPTEDVRALSELSAEELFATVQLEQQIRQHIPKDADYLRMNTRVLFEFIDNLDIAGIIAAYSHAHIWDVSTVEPHIHCAMKQTQLSVQSEIGRWTQVIGTYGSRRIHFKVRLDHITMVEVSSRMRASGLRSALIKRSKTKLKSASLSSSGTKGSSSSSSSTSSSSSSGGGCSERSEKEQSGGYEFTSPDTRAEYNVGIGVIPKPVVFRHTGGGYFGNGRHLSHGNEWFFGDETRGQQYTHVCGVMDRWRKGDLVIVDADADTSTMQIQWGLDEDSIRHSHKLEFRPIGKDQLLYPLAVLFHQDDTVRLTYE